MSKPSALTLHSIVAPYRFRKWMNTLYLAFNGRVGIVLKANAPPLVGARP